MAKGQRQRSPAPGPATMSSTVNNGAASLPSPPDAANGFPQPGASSGAWPRTEEELRAAEPGLVKRAHREILDHERKRRVELKCMELQEMMEEQGYSEEEIRQKVGTFRQMLMEKEGVLTREDRPGAHIPQRPGLSPAPRESHLPRQVVSVLVAGSVVETPRLTEGVEPGLEYAPFDEDEGPDQALVQQLGVAPSQEEEEKERRPPEKPGSCTHLTSGSGPGRGGLTGLIYNPPSLCPPLLCPEWDPGSCGSSSPLRKKKKSVKKHRRDRSRSPKSKRKEKNKERKRSRSPKSKRKEKNKERKRLSPKHRDDGRKMGSQRSSGSRSPSPSGGSGWVSPQQNGGSRQRSGAHSGRPGSAHSPPDDGEGRARHAEAEAARARRRSRSYSPIRKRRRDSPSFMEPRRITSARKRPIPYYRPSPSSSSSCLSSDYSSRSHSRSPSPGHSHGSYSSRSRGTRSRTRSPSRTPSPSYHSRSSSESGGF
ncbi:Serine/arginine repetitive matrix protein 3 [Tupaia chinensis]|uniref:Serine/arginine repetitive matrix protein 3 n=1 Tax=Tupaia chinensis TaxID=246437 RepID=L9K1A3_TUPCH|nr:Serine/arginine repetitive matrix protein 3 [Tupaia chinensis]